MNPLDPRQEDRQTVPEDNARREARPDSRSNGALRRAQTAARVAEENRGRDIVILDMRELTPVFDYFVIASGTSRRQLHAMSEEIDHALEDTLGDRRMGIEGYAESRWILLDYGDVVIHLFEPETRRYYALDDRCPHMGASLGVGEVRDGAVICDRHLWAYRLDDGVCPDTPSLKAKTYEVRVEGGDVQVRL